MIGGTAPISTAWRRGLAVAGDVARRLAAARRMADVNGIAQVEVFDKLRHVGGIVVHVVPSLTWLERP